MSWVRRIGWALVGLAALWLVALVIAGFALAGPTRTNVASRLGESLQASATLADGSLSLLRGRVDLDGLSVVRDDLGGHLALRIDTIACDLPPLGLALLDHGCRALVVRGVHFDVSSLALLRLPRPRRAPLHVDHLTIDDATIELEATALAPSLGKLSIHIDHADAGETTFKSPLSFLFALRELTATIDLPGNLALQLRYQLGQLEVAGSMFGAAPVTLPVSIPIAALGDDAATELSKLVALGKDLAEQVVTQRAEDWLKSKLSP